MNNKTKAPLITKTNTLRYLKEIKSNCFDKYFSNFCFFILLLLHNTPHVKHNLIYTNKTVMCEFTYGQPSSCVVYKDKLYKNN